MSNPFRKSFPETFILECKINLDDEDFSFWFDETENFDIIGYTDKNLIEPLRYGTGLWFEGIEYVLIYHAKQLASEKSVGASTSDTETNTVFFDSKSLEKLLNGVAYPEM